MQKADFPQDKVVGLHRSFGEAALPHAFGGAVALAFYAEPRETSDIDVNVFVPVERWPVVRESLSPLGVTTAIDEGELGLEAAIKLEWGGTPIHLFFSCDALHEEMARKVREVNFEGGTIPLVAPEHLVIRKTLLGRPKDRRDIERIRARTPIDQEEVDSWVRRLSGGS